jgi:hypothetical protein
MGKSVDVKKGSIMDKFTFKTFIENYCGFIDSYGFARSEIISNASFSNASIVFVSDKIQFKIKKDREEYFFEFSNTKDSKSDKWCDLDIIQNLLIKNQKYISNNRNIDFNKMYDTEKQFEIAKEKMDFIKDNFEKIIRIFKTKNYGDLKRKIIKLKNQRAKQLFG